MRRKFYYEDGVRTRKKKLIWRREFDYRKGRSIMRRKLDYGKGNSIMRKSIMTRTFLYEKGDRLCIRRFYVEKVAL